MTKKWVLSVCISVLVLTIVGCARGAMPASEPVEFARQAEDAFQSDMAMEEPAAPGRSSAADYASVERLIIRTASLDIVVPDTEDTVAEIKDLVQDMDGYVVESNLYQYQEGLRASITLRVPAESLDTALEQIRDLSTEVRRESISGQDVTEEYVDLESRLRNLEATDEKLLEFLEEAEDTEAALAVYEQLRQVEAEMEQVKGRMEYLEQSAALSTVTLDITPDALAQPIQVGGWRPVGTLRDAVEALIRVLQFLVDALIVIVVLVLPVLLVIAIPLVVLFLIARAIVRRRRANKESAAE